jgi:hypothetical protein
VSYPASLSFFFVSVKATDLLSADALERACAGLGYETYWFLDS